MKKKIASALLAVALAGGGVAVATTAAYAAPPAGCTQSPGLPTLSGTQITGTGTGTCNSSANRRLIYQVHRSEGWWHPNVAQNEDPGSKTSYSATATNCDAGSGSGTWQYFGQVFFAGFTASLSGNTGELSVCG